MTVGSLGPLLLVLLVVLGVGPLLAWRRTSAPSLWRNFRWPLLVAGLVGLALLALGLGQVLAVLAFASTAFALATIGLEYWRGVRARHQAAGEPYPLALVRLVRRAPRRYGGYLVHLGVVFIALGVIGWSFYQRQVADTLAIGESLTVGRYAFTYQGLFEQPEPGVQVTRARLTVRADGANLGELEPERRVHRNWEQQPVTGVAYRREVVASEV
ncbi:MAG: hypothetical protein HY690_02575 [Chloroflexi bacterium]|nr:hypothetical protein [Chloroflexota bacterium]